MKEELQNFISPHTQVNLGVHMIVVRHVLTVNNMHSHTVNARVHGEATPVGAQSPTEKRYACMYVHFCVWFVRGPSRGNLS